MAEGAVLVCVFALLELASNVLLLLPLLVQVLVHFGFGFSVAECRMLSPAAKLPILLEAIWRVVLRLLITCLATRSARGVRGLPGSR